ncbi:hypothetical protein Ctob_001275 [Chrysochromulina tobinii]|uniref:Uncharacterized protein n=1 Tax=Chrysochromulina tobinii TaxID=1460289 RepID=A0A0M0J648_9EUKA|nr:hypothetical protein Ctob_001275 [Chrysochromulina tobinii]|eukprot:KOO21698.1 hypothetical protein Ctob_001275 [Chrysochromulina sp. CCMP291]
MTELNLRWNSIGGEGAIAIAEALNGQRGDDHPLPRRQQQSGSRVPRRSRRR